MLLITLSLALAEDVNLDINCDATEVILRENVGCIIELDPEVDVSIFEFNLNLEDDFVSVVENNLDLIYDFAAFNLDETNVNYGKAAMININPKSMTNIGTIIFETKTIGTWEMDLGSIILKSSAAEEHNVNVVGLPVINVIAEPEVIPECPNNIKEEGEECDGEDFGELTCLDSGFDLGNLLCNEDCKVNDDECYYDIPSCIDTDDGEDYLVQGTVTYNRDYTDSCNEDVLTEYYCDTETEVVASTEYVCPQSCFFGACVEYPINALQSQITSIMTNVNFNDLQKISAFAKALKVYFNSLE